MEDIYEFENSEYRMASMQIKAIAYDVVTGISKKKIALKKDSEDSSLIQRLTAISDRIIEITDSLEEELEKLDQIEEKREIMIPESDTGIQEQALVDKKKEEDEGSPQKIKIDLEEELNRKQEIMEEKEEQQELKLPIKKDVESETKFAPEEPTIIEQNDQEVSLPDLNIKLADTTIEQQEGTPMEKTQETPQPQQIEASKKESTEISTKKRFQKMTKSLSKAIMVKPSQLQNLRKSHEYQEHLLANQGIFEMKAASEEVKKPIAEGTKELPKDIERQIEDLTVKANIYYNEGEVDKAQELYDKIRELNEQYKKGD